MLSVQQVTNVHVKAVYAVFGAFFWDVLVTVHVLEWRLIRHRQSLDMQLAPVIVARYAMLAALLGFLVFKVPGTTAKPDVNCDSLAVFIRASTSVAVVFCSGALVARAIYTTPVTLSAPLIVLFLAHAGFILVPAAYTTGRFIVNPATQAAQCIKVDRTPQGVWNAGTWSSVVLLVALCGLAVRAAQADRRFGWPWRRSCDPTWARLSLLALLHLVPATLGSLDLNQALTQVTVIPVAAVYVMLTTRIFFSRSQTNVSDSTDSQTSMTSDTVSNFRARMRGARWRREDRGIGSQRTRATLARYAGGGAGVVNATNSMNQLDILTVPGFDVGDDDETEDHKRHFESGQDLASQRPVSFDRKPIDADADSELESLGDLRRGRTATA